MAAATTAAQGEQHLEAAAEADVAEMVAAATTTGGQHLEASVEAKMVATTCTAQEEQHPEAAVEAEMIWQQELQQHRENNTWR